jgi:uncharacterized membrane protein YeaQ/YmgE (transglycosylase-associated protein family)
MKKARLERPAIRTMGNPLAASARRGPAPRWGSAGTTERVEEKMAVLGWMLFGLVVGAVAKLIMPGRDPGGIIVTMLLGIAGAVLAGFVGRALGWYGEGEAAGYLMSFVGAVALLALYRMMTRNRTTLTP